ncbi:MAG TPA: DUF6304 family protein [Burkholderiales bacterium]|jgi:hypothetical protein
MPSKAQPARYAGTYTDRHGGEAIVFENDGETLRTRIRGIEFSDRDFDGLAAETAVPETFTLAWGCLCACTFTAVVPVPLVTPGREVSANLEIRVELGEARDSPRGGISYEWVFASLSYDGRRFDSSGKSGWFEDELLEIQKALPDGIYIKACINCLYSDYGVAGHGSFGDMICFRTCKQEYLAVRSKQDYMAMEPPGANKVQEIHLCPDFARRIPGTGYRG